MKKILLALVAGLCISFAHATDSLSILDTSQAAQGIAGPQGPAGPAGATGPQGPQGPQGPTGVSGLTAKGAYSATTAYVVNDVVAYNGSAYACYAPSTGNLPTNTSFWALLVMQGATGPQGPQGPAGAAGATGPAGAPGTSGTIVPTWAITNSYVAGALAKYTDGYVYVANAAIPANTAWAVGTSGTTWRLIDKFTPAYAHINHRLDQGLLLGNMVAGTEYAVPLLDAEELINVGFTRSLANKTLTVTMSGVYEIQMTFEGTSGAGLFSIQGRIYINKGAGFVEVADGGASNTINLRISASTSWIGRLNAGDIIQWRAQPLTSNADITAFNGSVVRIDL